MTTEQQPINLQPTDADFQVLLNDVLREPIWQERLKVICLARMLRELQAAPAESNDSKVIEEAELRTLGNVSTLKQSK